MYSLSEAARLLGIERRTVADLARLNHVPIVRHPSNARGKAIDEAGFQVVKAAVARATIMPRKQVPAAASA